MMLTINGSKREIRSDPATPLLFVLRDELHLTGAKAGCGEGQCSACTVLIGGEPVHACLTTVAQVGDRPVETIEGLNTSGELRRVQQAFMEAGAFQCGFCTPGMVMAATALLKKNPHPSVAQIREGLENNICRCGTYNRILKAVQKAAEATSNA